jgi:hypothetical protein
VWSTSDAFISSPATTAVVAGVATICAADVDESTGKQPRIECRNTDAIIVISGELISQTRLPSQGSRSDDANARQIPIVKGPGISIDTPCSIIPGPSPSNVLCTLKRLKQEDSKKCRLRLIHRLLRPARRGSNSIDSTSNVSFIGFGASALRRRLTTTTKLITATTTTLAATVIPTHKRNLSDTSEELSVDPSTTLRGMSRSGCSFQSGLAHGFPSHSDSHSQRNCVFRSATSSDSQSEFLSG